jgi:hypothetical protein
VIETKETVAKHLERLMSAQTSDALSLHPTS